jgi:hypothetical protein
MPALEFSQGHVGLIQELAARLLDSRKPKTDLATLARDLLTGFNEICIRWGLDGLLAELEQALPGFDSSDGSTLADQAGLVTALVAQLDGIDLDGGGPRNLKPRQVADAVVAALGLQLAEPAERNIELDDVVHTEVTTALASVVNDELAVPKFRDTLIANGREQCEERYRPVFDKITAQLDERGARLVKQPKVPLDASQAVQRVLADTRNAIVERVVRTAFDRAKQIIERASPEAAARIDAPITLRLTPREVAITRACDSRVPKVPAAMLPLLLESLTQLVRITWRAPAQRVRTYGASQTFAVGDVIEHPKFGRGSVIAVQNQRIEVEFADGKHTLVHAK